MRMHGMPALIILGLSTIAVVYIVRLQERIRDLEDQLGRAHATSDALESPTVLGDRSPKPSQMAAPESKQSSLARSPSIRGELERILSQDRLVAAAQLVVRIRKI